MDVRGIVMHKDGRFEAVPIENIRPDLNALLWNKDVTPSIDRMASKSLPMAVLCGNSTAELIAFVAVAR